MNEYEDDYFIPETEQERQEREERARQAHIELRRKQRACPHTNRFQAGYGCEVNANGEVYKYVTTYCPDCWYEDEIEVSAP